ncbi:cytochrome c biogenesis protein [Salsuginibacillus halophilus]|uniref:Cytochrome c biogenesis protein n=1 Tax=Salsuginibacillus halophilus TaxID=517424 RepID=A0A2P8HW30_9BACI|nr:cytochrome c biogenesis protein ResB [Salsuginibacillus halophilus]PSL50443.1 cytochrome c biogenesis protein [Salsuginibacillus halophilus]
MEKVTCECGHQNPYGTELCERCGKPLKEQQQLLNMRYEGVARRSQTYNRSVVDKVWNFFSSVKVGIWIIFLILVASIFGTIFPQEMFIPPNVDPAQYYGEEYGIAGEIFYTLGFHNLYGSWWYIALLAALTTSLIIASIDRVVPLYRALKNQRVTRHKSFLSRQRIFGESDVASQDATYEAVKEGLKKKKYNISEENGNLVAEKNRFARWGPYVNHVGLVLFLTGAMLRIFPGMYVDENVWVRDGDTVPLPGTDSQYYLESEGFTMETYDEDDEMYAEALERSGGPITETYRTEAVLYERVDGNVVGVDSEQQKVKSHDIEVNDPLTYDSYSIYQVDYKLNELYEMDFELESEETGEVYGDFTVNLFDPEDSYEIDDEREVTIHSYFPDFYFDDDNEPSTRSSIPDNPAFIFAFDGPEVEGTEHRFVGIQQNHPVTEDPVYNVSFAGIDTNHVTALTVRKDLTLPFLMAGGAIFMIGLIQGSYWTHRRIWLQKRGDDGFYVAGHTNKNWESLKRDVNAAIDGTDIESPEDQIVKKEESKKQSASADDRADTGEADKGGR